MECPDLFGRLGLETGSAMPSLEHLGATGLADQGLLGAKGLGLLHRSLLPELLGHSLHSSGEP